MFDAWKSALAEIEQEISAANYTTWFTNTSLVSAEDGVVEIGVPNVFIKKQLEKKYTSLISTALKNAGIKAKVVHFVVQNSKAKAKRPREVSGRVEHIMKKAPKTLSNSTINTGLNSKYTLDNFVVGSNNDLAVSVAKAVVEKPGSGKFNPFFLYGGPGLGKTHLVQAIGNEILRRDETLKVLYIPISQFYSEFVRGIQKNQDMEPFRQKYTRLDVLIIDDFQFIMNKEKSQEEFFNIFNDLYLNGKQIIVTSDRLPREIKTVDARLASRLAMSGPIDLQMPSFEDRCAILKSKAEYMGAEIEDEAIEFLAENVKTSIRELEGELNRVLAVAEFKNISPLELINEGYINPVQGGGSKNVSPKVVVEKVAKYYDLSVKEMCGKSRVSHIKTARQVAMYVLSEELMMSTPKIAMEVGVKDHTTVMHGIKKIKSDLKLNFALREQIAQIREALYE